MGAARVLVVEDEENVAYVVCTALRLAGFEVIETQTGREALRLTAHGSEHNRPLDLIVLDVILPDIDGFEVCRRLRADRLEVPVVFLTARTATDDRVRGLAIGGDDYLPKPFSVEELVARVRVVLHRSGKVTDAGVLTCEDLVLDEDAYEVTRSGDLVALSPTEYRLLRLLLRNAGRVLTRDQILDHVWNYDFDGESTVVETFISSLRKKVDGRRPQLIHTVRGVGYRLSGR